MQNYIYAKSLKKFINLIFYKLAFVTLTLRHQNRK